MKKRVVKSEKLVIATESIRSLSNASLGDVGGGTSYLSYCFTVCSTKAMGTYQTNCPTVSKN